MSPPPDYVQLIDVNGLAVVPHCLGGDAVMSAAAALECIAAKDDRLAARRRGGAYAIRNLLDIAPALGVLAQSAEVRQLVQPILGPDAFLVRALLFDKTEAANWRVGWHQDLSIAVKQRFEMPGFGPWSTKAGVVHVQPPVPILERVLTVRLHIDDCQGENGPLRAIPGSHRFGRLSPNDIERWKMKACFVVCTVPAGGAVVMRPLLLHASSSALIAAHRRVLHFEFSAEPLPAPLEWREQVAVAALCCRRSSSGSPAPREFTHD